MPDMPTTNDPQSTYNQNSHIKIRVFCKVTPYRLVNCWRTSQIIYLPVDTTLTPRNSATFSNTAVRTSLSRKTYLVGAGLWRRFPSLTTSLPVSCCCCDFARTYCGVAIAIACCFVYKHQVEALSPPASRFTNDKSPFCFTRTFYVSGITCSNLHANTPLFHYFPTLFFSRYHHTSIQTRNTRHRILSDKTHCITTSQQTRTVHSVSTDFWEDIKLAIWTT
jgi:hypothetical protein